MLLSLHQPLPYVSLAFDLYCQTHIDFMKPILEVRLVEMCMHGTSPTIDYLILMRMIAYTVAGLRVTWLSTHCVF